MIYYKDLAYFKLVEFDGLVHTDELLQAKHRCYRDWKGQKVVFSLESSHFIGSPGFVFFIKDLNQFAQDSNTEIHFVGPMPELSRLIKGLALNSVQFHSSMVEAVKEFVSKKNTTEENPTLMEETPDSQR